MGTYLSHFQKPDMHPEKKRWANMDVCVQGTNFPQKAWPEGEEQELPRAPPPTCTSEVQAAGECAGRTHTTIYLQTHSGNFLGVSHRHKVLCFRDEMDVTDDLWKRLSLIVIHTYNKSDMCLETHHRLFSLAECPGKKHFTLNKKGEFIAGR